MISYDLAKELKNAGWPQPAMPNIQQSWPYAGAMAYPADPHHEASDHAYAPSLSELIAACPQLYQHPPHSYGFELQVASLGWWCARYGDPEEDEFWLDEYGSTPEEAVSRLWLKLKEGKV